jgi:hypothetical protein
MIYQIVANFLVLDTLCVCDVINIFYAENQDQNLVSVECHQWNIVKVSVVYAT